MNTFFNTSLVLFSLIIIISCQEKDNPVEIHEIPIEDRFLYDKGDTLFYKCSDGSVDTSAIKDYRFWTIAGTSRNMFGNEIRYETDLQRIMIESPSNQWNDILKVVLSSDDVNHPCFIIETVETIYDANENPYCWIINGCNYEGGLPIVAEGDVKYTEISFNNNSYKKVHFDSRENGENSFKVYWNLKYGIIRFESVYNGALLTWDLESY